MSWPHHTSKYIPEKTVCRVAHAYCAIMSDSCTLHLSEIGSMLLHLCEKSLLKSHGEHPSLHSKNSHISTVTAASGVPRSNRLNGMSLIELKLSRTNNGTMRYLTPRLQPCYQPLFLALHMRSMHIRQKIWHGGGKRTRCGGRQRLIV